MTDFGVSYGSLSGKIYAGRINKAGTAFTSKSDQTMPALLAVADYVLGQFDGEVELLSKGELGYRIIVERVEE